MWGIPHICIKYKLNQSDYLNKIYWNHYYIILNILKKYSKYIIYLKYFFNIILKNILNIILNIFKLFQHIYITNILINMYISLIIYYYYCCYYLKMYKYVSQTHIIIL